MSFLDRIAAAITPAGSDDERADARRKAEQLASTEPWLAQILEQHRAIECLVHELWATPGPEGLKRLASALTAHAGAEESVLYPDVSEFSGATHAAMAYEEHAMVKVELAMLEKVDPAQQEWREKLDHIRRSLQQHMYQEEGSWLPDLAGRLPEHEKARIARRFSEEYERYRGAHTAATTGARSHSGPAPGQHETQAMPHDGRPGAPDGVNTQAEWRATGGSDAGAPHPRESGPGGGDFAQGAMSHGGQSKIGYHGSGQLGEQEVKPGGNVNSGTKSG